VHAPSAEFRNVRQDWLFSTVALFQRYAYCLQTTSFDASLIELQTHLLKPANPVEELVLAGLIARARNSCAPVVEQPCVTRGQNAGRACPISSRIGPLRIPTETSVVAASRWAQLIVRVAQADHDPRTIESWAAICNLSYATLRNRCRAAKVAAKNSLDLARMLRAIVQGNKFGCSPSLLLEGDPRTIQRLHRLAGDTDIESSSLTSVVRRLVRLQHLITEPSLLLELEIEVMSCLCD
jgi:hypothetical protein